VTPDELTGVTTSAGGELAAVAREQAQLIYTASVVDDG